MDHQEEKTLCLIWWLLTARFLLSALWILTLFIAMPDIAAEPIAEPRKGKVAVSATQRTYDKTEFDKLLREKMRPEILSFLGQPSNIYSTSRGDIWVYSELGMRKGDPVISDSVTGQRFNTLQINFRQGTIHRIYFSQSPSRSCFPKCF
jgi:hypothetical protein